MKYTTILDYWFGKVERDEDIAKDKQSLWFQGGKEVDIYIIEHFKNALEEAKKGALNEWKETPRQRLALIILLDQFSRNIYRNNPQMYESDSLSLELCTKGIEQEMDCKLFPVYRQFFYMPLQHVEDLTSQQKSVELYTQLKNDAPQSTKEYFAMAVKSAKRHCEIIELFGRFPHRNKILGRLSTAEEKAFLETPDSSF
ncbi:DUF924 family protein [Candidatus Uabimicrobium sp. HlEnr_7]|uniref:DUF924 family protein n=1 Tax=Candidatus Uabimicrobium helgolandensis TaxID=3095367 RepID=UPI003556A464